MFAVSRLLHGTQVYVAYTVDDWEKPSSGFDWLDTAHIRRLHAEAESINPWANGTVFALDFRGPNSLTGNSSVACRPGTVI